MSNTVTKEYKMPFIPSVIIGYLLGCYFTPYMFIDLRLTEWYNVFVYFWIFCWPLALFLHFVIWLFASGALFVVIFAPVLLLVAILASAWLLDQYTDYKRAKISKSYRNRSKE